MSEKVLNVYKMNRKTLNKLTIPNSPHCLPQIFFKLLKRIQSLVMIIKFTMLVAFDPYFTCKPAGDQVSAISELRPVYTGVFCRGNSMQFFSVALKLQLQNRTCKPGEIFSAICLRDIGGFEHVRNLKLHRVAATKIACVNGPLDCSRSPIFRYASETGASTKCPISHRGQTSEHAREIAGTSNNVCPRQYQISVA